MRGPIRAALPLLAALGCGRPTAALLPPLERPLIFAHRGGSGEAPESTLASLLAAARDPAVAIELDVRATRDGHIVVIHDASVDRTTNGTGRVAELTLAELEALDAGHCATPGLGAGTARRGDCAPAADPQRFPFRGRGIRIPTLAAVLAQLPAHTFIGIEVKAPGFEPALAALLRASGRLGRLVIGSADGAVAARLRALLPEAPTYFPRNAAVRLALGAKLAGAAFARPEHQLLAAPRTGWGLRLDTPGMIGAYHRQGVAVIFFTINDETEMERLLRLGADGLFTDYPTRARALVERLRAEGALPR
jgi:glycerophosphoryl diester phosphodiesterase